MTYRAARNTSRPRRAWFDGRTASSRVFNVAPSRVHTGKERAHVEGFHLAEAVAGRDIAECLDDAFADLVREPAHEVVLDTQQGHLVVLESVADGDVGVVGVGDLQALHVYEQLDCGGIAAYVEQCGGLRENQVLAFKFVLVGSSVTSSTS